jgi:hypothetical protein
MKSFIHFVWLAAFLFLAESVFAVTYTMSVSKNRKDGTMVDVQPHYPYVAELYVTMSPALCVTAGTPTPLADLKSYLLLRSFNRNMDGRQDPSVFFHLTAPAGVNLCYLLVGRGQVEAVDWGYRKAEWEEPSLTPSGLGLSATRDRADGVEIFMNPALTEFTDLYLTPVEDKNCPDIGQGFDFKGRWMQPMADQPFNGKYYFHKKAPLGIDLCYFLISRKTNLVVGKAIGFRPL